VQKAAEVFEEAAEEVEELADNVAVRLSSKKRLTARTISKSLSLIFG